MDHFHTPHASTATPFAASLTLFGMAFKLWPPSGIDWPTFAAVCGGLGTLLMGIVSFSREVRTWLDRRKGKAQ